MLRIIDVHERKVFKCTKAKLEIVSGDMMFQDNERTFVNKNMPKILSFCNDSFAGMCTFLATFHSNKKSD